MFLNTNTPQNDSLKGNASLITVYSCHHFFQKTKMTEINQVNDSQANKQLFNPLFLMKNDNFNGSLCSRDNRKVVGWGGTEIIIL